MLKQIIIGALLLISHTSGSIAGIVIPGAGVQFPFPDGWENIDGKGFKKIIAAVHDKAEFKNAVDALSLDQVNKYLFVKKFNRHGEVVNSNFILVTMQLDGEVLDLDEIFDAQVAEKKSLPGILEIRKGVCPELNTDNYRCLTQHTKRGERLTRQFHYLTTNKGMYIQFSFNAANSDEVREVRNIIAGILFE